jgi:2'-5' RNA ligase
MRLFVGLWPDGAAAGAIEQLERAPEPAVRWTSAPEWHVTLRFLGEVAEGAVSSVADAVATAAAGCVPRTIELGPATTRLGRGQLVLPAAGADDLAAAVVAATARLGQPPEDRPFTGHLTVARGRGRRPVPPALEGTSLITSWWADEVALVRSHLEQGGPRYETIARAPLGG